MEAPAPIMPRIGRVRAAVYRTRTAERRRVVFPVLIVCDVAAGRQLVNDAAEHVEEGTQHLTDWSGA